MVRQHDISKVMLGSRDSLQWWEFLGDVARGERS